MSLNIDQVTKIYHSGQEDIIALDNISLNINTNSFTCIVGSSGSGKSTLLHLIAGLEIPTSGHIYLHNVELNQMDDKKLSLIRNKEIGFVFQQFMLLKDFTVLENVMLPHYILSGDKQKSQQKALELLDTLQLKHKAKQYPYEISGGEAQRVAIARALINNPSLVLADEPTGNLDEKNQEKVLQILLEMKKQNPFTLILVTHNLDFSKQADHTITLEFGKLKSSVHSPKN